MPDQQPTPDQSFSIHLKSLTDFADEFTTQIQSLQAPMDHLATMSDTPPQYGAFAEAWSLGAGEQAAIEEMYSLLGQVKQAIAFAGRVTGTVADGYRHADEDISSALGGAPLGSNQFEHGGPVDGGHHHHSWQDTQVTDGQATFADPGPPPGGADPGPFPPADPAGGSHVTAVLLDPAHAGDHSVVGSSVGHLVTGAQGTDGRPSVWTPPPAPQSSAPAPSWTDYFQGSPQGGA
ncbi:MAG: hypothetical protein HOW97_15990 [Catenulispora sp.]|nr:hypothetical protein [Catenulispora sp.]